MFKFTVASDEKLLAHPPVVYPQSHCAERLNCELPPFEDSFSRPLSLFHVIVCEEPLTDAHYSGT